MTTVWYPTDGTSDHAKPGHPHRALACHCEPGPLYGVGDDTCWRCGLLLQSVIDRTWAERARMLARRERRWRPHNNKRNPQQRRAA